MEAQEIVAVIAQVISLGFMLLVGVVWLMGAKKDGKLTKDEIAPVSIIGVFIFMMIMNGFRDTEVMVFDTTTVLLVLGSVVTLAGIDIAKAKRFINGDRDKDSRNGK